MGTKTSLSLHAKDDGGYVRVHENSGEVMAVMAGNTETGLVTVFGPQGEEAGTLSAGEHGGLISFADAAGERKSRLPYEKGRCGNMYGPIPSGAPHGSGSVRLPFSGVAPSFAGIARHDSTPDCPSQCRA